MHSKSPDAFANVAEHWPTLVRYHQRIREGTKSFESFLFFRRFWKWPSESGTMPHWQPFLLHMGSLIRKWRKKIIKSGIYTGTIHRSGLNNFDTDATRHSNFCRTYAVRTGDILRLTEHNQRECHSEWFDGYQRICFSERLEWIEWGVRRQPPPLQTPTLSISPGHEYESIDDGPPTTSLPMVQKVLSKVLRIIAHWTIRYHHSIGVVSLEHAMNKLSTNVPIILVSQLEYDVLYIELQMAMHKKQSKQVGEQSGLHRASNSPYCYFYCI